MRRCAKALQTTGCACRWRFFDRAITGQLVRRITNTPINPQLYVQVLFDMRHGVTVLIVASLRWGVALLAVDADLADAVTSNYR